MLCNKAHFLSCAIFVLFKVPLLLIAQNDTINITLSFDTTYVQNMSTAWITFSDSTNNQTLIGKAPGDIDVVRILDTNSVEANLKFDSNSDGIIDEKIYKIKPDSTIKIYVFKKYNLNSSIKLPYLITYRCRKSKSGEIKETFYWRPRYRVTGLLKYGSCQEEIGVLDLSGDGKFDNHDFKLGTNITIDKNGDGKIWGKDEYLIGEQLFEFCGKIFEIIKISPNGSDLSIKSSSISVPNVGESVPNFKLKAINDKVISSADLNGKIYLLDFWASWCIPCIEKFKYLQKMDKNINEPFEIIAINVDDKSRLSIAQDVAKEYQIEWPQIMNGLANSDPIWKMFGSSGTNRLSIPLYVLVDKTGKIQYMGNGGNELKELKDKIFQLIKN